MSLNITDDKSKLVQVLAWCHQATSHYLKQFCPRSVSPYGITRSQWVNTKVSNQIDHEMSTVICIVPTVDVKVYASTVWYAMLEFWIMCLFLFVFVYEVIVQQTFFLIWIFNLKWTAFTRAFLPNTCITNLSEVALILSTLLWWLFCPHTTVTLKLLLTDLHHELEENDEQ